MDIFLGVNAVWIIETFGGMAALCREVLWVWVSLMLR